MHGIGGGVEADSRANSDRPVWPIEEVEGNLTFAELQQKLLWLASAAYRSRWLMLAAIFAALIIGGVATLMTTPLYTATATVQIDQQTERVLGTEDEQPGTAFQDSERFLQTNIEVLQSRSTATRVAQNLNLFRDNSFIEKMGGTNKPEASLSRRREDVLKLLDENLVVNLPRNSRVASISFQSPDPALSSRIANAFAENYITGNLQRKFNSTAYARSFLEKQLAPARERLEMSERQMIDYARQAGLIDTQAAGSDDKDANSGSITIASLTSLNDALAAATANRITAEQRLRVAKKSPVAALPESYSNMGIQRLYETRAGRVAELQDELERHKEGFPTVIQARAEITELDKQIDRMNSDIRRSIHDQYETARRQELALATEVERMKLAALTEKDRSVQYNTLRRDVDANRSMYEALLQRYKEVSAASGIAANNISVVDRADPPSKPTSPKLIFNLLIAFVLGCLIALVIAVLRELFDDRVQNAADIERKFDLVALGIVPQFKNSTSVDQELALHHSSIGEAYRSIATATLLSRARSAPSILTLTSAQSGEGKTSSTIGIASALTTLNKRVVVIEGDLRRPSLKNHLANEMFDAELPGLSEHLADQAISPTIRTHKTLNFDYILSGKIPPDPVELLGSLAFASMLDDLRERYDHIVIDAPPVLGLADVHLIASQSEALIFIIEANRSHRGRAKVALNRVRRFGVPIIGSVLTKAPSGNRFGYGYGDEYYSYR